MLLWLTVFLILMIFIVFFLVMVYFFWEGQQAQAGRPKQAGRPRQAGPSRQSLAHSMSKYLTGFVDPSCPAACTAAPFLSQAILGFAFAWKQSATSRRQAGGRPGRQRQTSGSGCKSK